MAGKANSIKLFSFSTPQMRAFHLSWVAFFVCFFAWFACAPLMPVIKGEFHLSAGQIADINIAAVAALAVPTTRGPNITEVGYWVITKLAPTAPIPRRNSRKLS